MAKYTVQNIYSNNCTTKKWFINIWHSHMFQPTKAIFREMVIKGKSSDGLLY
jgi:hypothetical protein